ncbi:MAG: hypothetical protein KIS76_06400 [Pyrinomonadaceae bacterium]|nr:hypothetical protein [Pyrinomonadaceae bacterium]
MFELSLVKDSRKRLVAYFAATVLAIGSFFYLLETIILVVFSGGSILFWNVEHAVISPDGKYRVEISRKLDISAGSLFSPAGNVDISLISNSTGARYMSGRFDIHEYSELSVPELDWRSDSVTISNVEAHREFALTLKLPTE